MNDFEWNRRSALAGPSRLAERLDELRSSLRLQDPGLVAARSGSSWLTLGPGRGE